MSERSGSGRWRLWVAIALALAGVAAFFLLPLREWLDALVGRAEAMGDAGAFLFAALYIPFCILLLPGTLVTLVCGLTYGFWPTFPAVVLASNVGAGIAFFLGRTLLRQRVQGWIARRPRLAAVERAIGEESFRLVFLLRLTPMIPFNALNYLLGVTPVRFARCALATFLGMLPGTALNCFTFATAGEISEALRGEEPLRVSHITLLVLRVLASLVAIVLVTRAARRALARNLPPAVSGEEA
jgi:uncharacterized membrane protein YdjX (TVP38/TMEM64 family)